MREVVLGLFDSGQIRFTSPTGALRSSTGALGFLGVEGALSDL